jgi:transcriptional regulator with GAF, ATPase, and Fis domain
VNGVLRRTPEVPSPYDATAALERMLRRLRAETGATRISVVVHEATTEIVVPFRQALADSLEARALPELRTAVTLARSAFMSAVVRDRRPVQARADGRRATDKDLAQRGVRSAHGEPLIRDGEVVGVLTVEPAAAAVPHLLRQVSPKLAVALTEAWTRHSESRRLAQAEVLVGLIEAASTAESMDHLLATACRRMAQLGEVERACVFLLEDGRLVPRMVACADGRREAATWELFRNAPVGMELAETVLSTGQPLAADKDSGLLSGWWVERFQVSSGLAVPLGRAPDITGVLTLDSTRVRPFSQDVRRLAAAAGAHLGGVIEQARTSEARAAAPAPAEAVPAPALRGAGPVPSPRPASEPTSSASTTAATTGRSRRRDVVRPPADCGAARAGQRPSHSEGRGGDPQQ